MSKTGQIIVGPKVPALTCRVVDYSAGGACLDIYGLGSVPDRFEFHYGGVRKKSHIVWRRGIRIGVAFVSEGKAQPIPKALRTLMKADQV